MAANTAMQPDSAPLPDDLRKASDLLHEAAAIIGGHLVRCPSARPCVTRMVAGAAMMAEQARDEMQLAYNIQEAGETRAANRAAACAM